MNPTKRARLGDDSETGSQISGGEPQTRGDGTQGRAVIASRTYERGFCDGWRDRAAYGRRSRLTFDDGHEVGWAAGYEAALRDETGMLLTLLGRMGCDERWIGTLADVLAGDSHKRGEGYRPGYWVHDRTLNARERRREADRPAPRSGDWPGLTA